MILTSSLLARHGFQHGFGTRSSRHEDLASALGVTLAEWFEITQVHKAHLVAVEKKDRPTAIRTQEADALTTKEPIAVAVRTADCLPLLLANAETGQVAAVHCGWRSIVARIVDATLEQLAPVKKSSIFAAIGPHIRTEAFEVSEEVAEKISNQAHDTNVVTHPSGEDGEMQGFRARQETGASLATRPRPHVSLAATVTAQLRNAGVSPNHIDDIGGCTYNEPLSFHSFRRDSSNLDRQLSAIRGMALST